MITILCFLILHSFSLGAVIYLSPDGNDLNNGLSINSPFRNVEKAITKYREIKSGEAVTIQIASGDYRLYNKIPLTSADNPTGDLSIIGIGNKPVITGSVALTGEWKNTGRKNIWVLENIDQIIQNSTGNAPSPPYHNLYVNNKRVIRARHPNYGTSRQLSLNSSKSIPVNKSIASCSVNGLRRIFCKYKTIRNSFGQYEVIVNHQIREGYVWSLKNKQFSNSYN